MATHMMYLYRNITSASILNKTSSSLEDSNRLENFNILKESAAFLLGTRSSAARSCLESISHPLWSSEAARGMLQPEKVAKGAVPDPLGGRQKPDN